MKIAINRDLLLKPLQMVAGVVERRQTFPILAHVLVVIQKTQMMLIGTDTEVELCGMMQLEGNTIENSQFTVPGRKFVDICRALPEGSVLEIAEENGRVTVSSGRSRFVLSCLQAKDFPRTTDQAMIMEFNIPQGALRNLIEKTSFAIPQQDVRQYLNGLLVEVKEGKIRALATDGHRLALNVVDAQIANDSFAQIIVPRKGVSELSRLLNDSDNSVNVVLNNSFIRIIGDDFIFTSKLISGKFPNYSKVIPKQCDKQIVINKNALKQALTRVGILSNELFRSARFQLDNNVLRLTTNNPDQEEAVEELVIDYLGDKFETIFNINYFLDVINCISTENVSVSLKDDTGSAVVEEYGSDSNNLYILMPIRQ